MMLQTAIAGEGFDGTERYASNAFDNCLGKVVPVWNDSHSRQIGTAKVVDVLVTNLKGQGVYVTFETTYFEGEK